MHKPLKVFLICLASAFAILIIGLGCIYIRGTNNESKTKGLLSDEIGRLPVPQTCKESKRTYQRGGVDTNSAWFVDYSCVTTIGVAQEYITKDLVSHGFSEKDVASYPPFTRKIFTNQTLYIDYFFIRSLDKNDNLQPYAANSSLQLLSVHVYRAGHAY